MNAVVNYDPSVPAFLRNANFLALNQKAAAGLATGSAPARLSFKGSRWRKIEADGNEAYFDAAGPVGNNSITLDVIVLDASDHVSKFYYDKKYDPNADDMSPACFSDNGVGPSVRAAKPQSLLCQNCPHNAWGSKVSETGSQIKACSDVKKLAVIPVSNVTGPAYMLGIPAASLKTWANVVQQLSQRGVPIPAMVMQLGFDQTVAFPKLTFSPQRWISEQEAAAISDLFGSDECNELVGRKDMPIQALPAPAAAAPAPAPAAQPQAPFPAAPQPAPAQNWTAPTPAFQQPQPAPAPVFTPAAPAPAAPAAEAPRRRGGRRPAAETTAAAPAAPAPVFTPPAAPAAPPAPAPAGAPDLSALLDQVMLGGKK